MVANVVLYQNSLNRLIENTYDEQDPDFWQQCNSSLNPIEMYNSAGGGWSGIGAIGMGFGAGSFAYGVQMCNDINYINKIYDGDGSRYYKDFYQAFKWEKSNSAGKNITAYLYGHQDNMRDVYGDLLYEQSGGWFKRYTKRLGTGNRIENSYENYAKNIFEQNGLNCSDDGINYIAKNSKDLSSLQNNINKVLKSDKVKTLVNSTDDVAKAVSNSTDDVAKAVSNSTDDVAKAGINNIDDVAKAGINNIDDVATTITKTATKTSSKMGKIMGKVGSQAGLIMTVAMGMVTEGSNIVSSFSEQGAGKGFEQLGRSLGNIAINATCAAAGEAIGGIIGGAIGSILPGAGTAIGIFVGKFIGSTVGSIIGGLLNFDSTTEIAAQQQAEEQKEMIMNDPETAYQYACQIQAICEQQGDTSSQNYIDAMTIINQYEQQQRQQQAQEDLIAQARQQSLNQSLYASTYGYSY